jgi:dynactin complex subunit
MKINKGTRDRKIKSKTTKGGNSNIHKQPLRTLRNSNSSGHSSDVEGDKIKSGRHVRSRTTQKFPWNSPGRRVVVEVAALPSTPLHGKVRKGSKLEGTVRFVGKTSFSKDARLIWVGVELDQAKGSHNGEVEGHCYFICEPNHGLFVLESATTPLLTKSASKTRNKSKHSAKTKSAKPPYRLNSEVVVMIKKLGRKVDGIVKFIGQTNFHKKIMVGVELVEAAGKTNGTVNNVPYFFCRKRFGLFLPIASKLLAKRNKQPTEMKLKLRKSSPSSNSSSSSKTATGGSAKKKKTQIKQKNNGGPSSAMKSRSSRNISALEIKANQKENSKRLRQFFKIHNPSKVVKVDQMLSKWAGKETQLFKQIADKYKDSPDAAYLKAKC